MENIPGLYRVIIENKSINGLSEDWKSLKYDNGVTTETDDGFRFNEYRRICLKGRFCR